MRVHNTSKKPEALGDVAQRDYQRKPQGLWFANVDEWADLLDKGTSPGLNDRQVAELDFEVTIGVEFKLLELRSAEDLMAFSVEYGQPMPHAQNGFFWQRPGTRDSYDPDQDEKLPDRCRAFLIDWERVSETWDGIEISCFDEVDRPYFEWLDTDWGLNSGCAWRMEGISLELIKVDKSPEP